MAVYVCSKDRQDRSQCREWQTQNALQLATTAITFRLLYGGSIDLLTLARNALTSVEMVEKFYSSNLTAEMNIDLLQGRRKKS
jgi:hypothetical protein